MTNNTTAIRISPSHSASPWQLDDFGIFGLIATDQSLVVRFWNEWMVTHSGLKTEEVIGRSLLHIFPSLVERNLDKLYYNALAGEPAFLAQRIHKYLIPLCPDGSPVKRNPSAGETMCQRAAIVPMVREGSVIGTITLIDDVTERVLRENELQRRIAIQEALVETSRGILSLDLQECLKRIASETSALLGAELVAILLPKGNALRVVACVVDGHSCEISRRIELPSTALHNDLPDDLDVAARVWMSGRIVRLDDLAGLPAGGKPRPFHPECRSTLAAPLQVGNSVLGAIIAESIRPGAFTQSEEQLLLQFTPSAAIAIQNARLYNERTESEKRIRTLMETVPSAIVALDRKHLVIEFNSGAEKMLGWTRAEVINRDFLQLCVPQDKWDVVTSSINLALEGSPVRGLELDVRDASGKPMVFLWNIAPCADAANQGCVIASGQDITARKQAEIEKEKLIAELRNAMAEIKTLRGFIPICAGCKKIRDDKGFWVQVEAYISSRSEAKFSHGLCPDCMRKYYPDLEFQQEPSRDSGSS